MLTKVDEQLAGLDGQVAKRAADKAPGLAAVQRRLLEQLENPGVERDIARLGDGQAGRHGLNANPGVVDIQKLPCVRLCRSPTAGMIPILTLGSDITASSRSS